MTILAVITNNDVWGNYSTYDPPILKNMARLCGVQLQIRPMTHQRSTYDPPIRLMTHPFKVVFSFNSIGYGIINRKNEIRPMTHQSSTYDPLKFDL